MKTYFFIAFCLVLLTVFPHVTQAQSAEDLLTGECTAILFNGFDGEANQTLKLTFNAGKVLAVESNESLDRVPPSFTYDLKLKSRTKIALNAKEPAKNITATIMDNGHLHLKSEAFGDRLCEYSSQRALTEADQTAQIEAMTTRLAGEWVNKKGGDKVVFTQAGEVRYEGGEGNQKGTFKVFATGQDVVWMQIKSDDGKDWVGYALFAADNIAELGVVSAGGQYHLLFDRVGGAITATAVEEAPKLAEKELDYVLLAGTIACYNMRLADTAKASTAVAGYLASEGLTTDEYIALEKEHGAKPAVRAAIKEEMELCPTRVLPNMEEEATVAELAVEEVDCTKTPEHEECKIDCKKTPTDPKCEFNFAKRSYSASYTANGVTGGKIVFNFDKNGKSAGGFVSGKVGATAFTISLRGNRDKNSIKLIGSGKNSGTAFVALNKKAANGSFSGTANGRALSFSFSSATK